MLLYLRNLSAPVWQMLRHLFPARPDPADYHPGSLWFSPGEQVLFFVKDIRKGRSHPGVVKLSHAGGRAQVSACSHRDMHIQDLVAVKDIPPSLQTRSLARVIASLNHDLHTMHHDPEDAACSCSSQHFSNH